MYTCTLQQYMDIVYDAKFAHAKKLCCVFQFIDCYLHKCLYKYTLRIEIDFESYAFMDIVYKSH